MTEISSVIYPITCDWRVRRFCAITFGRYPNCFIALRTACFVFSEIFALGTLFIIRETVVCETPDNLATSFIVGNLFILLIRITNTYYNMTRSFVKMGYKPFTNTLPCESGIFWQNTKFGLTENQTINIRNKLTSEFRWINYPKAWHQHSDLLQVEGKIRRNGCQCTQTT